MTRETGEEDTEPAASTLLEPGENCWNTARATRFGWLIDGEAYFRALRESLEAAEREILIVGWDIESDVELIRDEDHRFYPSPLAGTLEHLAERNPNLRIYVLSWDFAMVYVLERELLPAYRFGWQDRENLHFHLDGTHATGASHHQKFVVIDGALAYIGGFDLTKSRWDSRQHAPDDPRRVNSDGKGYRPFHDVQAIVSGEPAGQLRELASLRWENATGSALPSLDESYRASAAEMWPGDVPVRGRDVATGLARSWSSADGSELVQEVERLYLDMIRAARKHIYIENQYFTSVAIAEALCARLSAADGPEIVIVLPAESAGWLEQATMDVLRNGVLHRLREADRHDRLRVLTPVYDALTVTSINVHGKVMVVDDHYVRIGSANLSRRSMGLDSECDIVAVEKDGAMAGALRADLLAEHLDADRKAIEADIADLGLLAALDKHNGGERRLEPLEMDGDEIDDVLEPIAKIADLEKPVERAWDQMLEQGEQAIRDGSGAASRVRRVLDRISTPAAGWTFLAIIVLGIIGWAVWEARTASDDLDPMALLNSLRDSATHPLAPLAVVPAFVAGSLVIAPVTGMIAVCALLFGPWTASLSAIAGTLAATTVNFEIGRHLGLAVEGRAPRAVTVRMKALGRSSDAWSLAGLRLIPIAPFTVINLLAGASRVKLSDFLLGTLIGMGPGTVLICFSVDRARAALSGEPVFEPWVLAVIVGAGIALITLRALQRRRNR